MTIKDEICHQVNADVRLCDDGTLWIKTDKIADIGRVIVEDGKTSCKQFYQDAQPEPCEDAVSRTEVLQMINCINDHHAITPYKSVGAVTEHLTRIASNLPPVTPKQPEQRTEALKAEIRRMKRSFTTCINSDYYTGYMCALSAVEGYIAQLEGDAE